MDPKNKTGVGFYMDKDQHKKIREWCDSTKIDFFVFCRVATQHLFFYLTVLPGQGPRDLTAFLKQIKS
jgi:hypothetical protein